MFDFCPYNHASSYKECLTFVSYKQANKNLDLKNDYLEEVIYGNF